jgi:hypothetical protein
MLTEKELGILEIVLNEKIEDFSEFSPYCLGYSSFMEIKKELEQIREKVRKL